MRGFEPFRPFSATRLSGLAPARATGLGAFVGLARLSLLAACLFALPSCLVDDPPPYAAPKQTPPRLDYENALPLLDQVIVANDGDVLNFSIPVTSEDAGEGLTALLLLDYIVGAKAPDLIAYDRIGPSTLSDPDRKFQMQWAVQRVVPGCHRFTLRAGHDSNLPSGTATAPVKNPADLAEAFWWANINADPLLGSKLVDCPGASRGTP